MLQAERSLSTVRRLLQLGLVVVLLLPGADQVQYAFTKKWWITDWNDYVAPAIPALIGLDRDTIMLITGLVEIVVAIMVTVRPRAGSIAACIGLWLIIANLLLHSAYDIVIRDFGLSLAALALAISVGRKPRLTDQPDQLAAGPSPNHPRTVTAK